MENKIYFIGNAHLDPVWLWRWQEGYAEVMATFRSALDRIKEYDDFIFTCAGALYYKWIEQTDPNMFEEIKQAVVRGKWVIVGGWWIQPDCNAPSGDSFARHALYSQRYFEEKFGVTATVGYNVDSFGHSGMLPQILKNSGMDSYVFMRPMPNEKAYPFKENAFIWRSADGSEVTTYRIPESYCTNLFDSIEEKTERHIELAKETSQPIMCFYGVGNHGGGPTKKNIDTIHGIMEKKGKGLKLSSPNEYFDSLKGIQLPVLEGDLQHHASGCYSAIMAVKKGAAAAVSKAFAAESINLIASELLVEKPEKLDAEWEKIMFNQFHDIMGGCCIRPALEDAVEELASAKNGAEHILNRARQAIAWNIDTSKGEDISLSRPGRWTCEQDGRGVPLVVFNPNAYEVTAPVFLAHNFASIEDNEGNSIACQNIRNTLTVETASQNISACFVAKIPAMGWRLFWGYGEKKSTAKPEGILSVSRKCIENDWLKVTVKSGRISSIFDKRNGRELLKSSVRALVMDEEKCDTWMHDVFSYEKLAGEFSFSDISITESGDVCCRLRVKGKYKASKLILDITLYRELPELYVKVKVDWREKHKALKICFPTVFEKGTDICGIPFGSIKRSANGKEQPMQRFVAVSEGNCGFSVATDSRTAYDCKNGLIRITALRSPIFADHYGIRDAISEFSEQGEQEFSFAVSPFEGDVAKLSQLSELMLSPVDVIAGTYHGGKLPAEMSALSVSEKNIQVTALKRAEDENGYILRCYETDGKPVTASFSSSLLSAQWSASFGAHQIKSFHISSEGVAEVDFLEKNK